MPIAKFRNYVATEHDHFVMGLVGTVLIGLTLLSHPTLREFSSALSVVCLMGLLWRVIGTLPRMTPLSIMLSVSLAVNLGTGAIAQYLLSRQIELLPMPSGPHPDNTLGLTLVLLSRVFILLVIIVWTRWLAEELE